MKEFALGLLVRVLKWAAQRYLTATKPLIIGITGSVGKTSCRLIISDTLKKLLPQELVYTSPKNYNSDLGLSLSILGIENYKPSIDGVLNALYEGLGQAFFPNKKPSIMVLEYGIDKPGDMDVLLSIVKPHIAILTAIDGVHGENFPDGIQGIYNEKVKLIKAANDVVFFENGVVGPEYLQPGVTPLTFGKDGQFGFENYGVNVSGDRITTSYVYKINNDGNQSGLTITTNVCGEHNVLYQCIGLTIADILSHRKKYPSLWTMQALHLPINLQPGRFTMFLSQRGDVIIDSSYNASPASMRAVIFDALQLQHEFFSDYRTILILGEMRELGEISKQEHIDLGKRIDDKADFVIGVSGDSVYMTDYLIGLHKANITRTETNLQAGDEINKIMNANPNSKFFMIFKSSQGQIWLEEAIKQFILPAQWIDLPRQEQYRLSKKAFSKKLYLSHNDNG